MTLDSIKNRILNLISGIDNHEWVSCTIVYEFAPFINKGFVSSASFWTSKNDLLDFYMKYDLDLNNMLYTFIFHSKIIDNNNNNQIIFSTNRDDYSNAKIDFNFNQNIEDRFQNNLPKSKKGKTLPWWKNDEETKGLKKVVNV